MKTFLQKTALLLGLGAIFVTFSEFWFYPVNEDTSGLIVLLAYGVLSYAFVMVLKRYHTSSFHGFFVAACLLGFFIEGGVVPYLYTILPISIVWTSMAWHALISVTVGWYLVHKMATAPFWKETVFYITTGAFLGGWNTLLWNTLEGPDDAALVWEWVDPMLFTEQFLFAFGLFLGGHLLYRFARAHTLTFTKADYWIMGMLIIPWTLATMAVIIPFSLVLIPLVWMCIHPLHKGRDKEVQQPPILSWFDQNLPGIRSYCLMTLIPLTAIPTYWILATYQLQIEWNALLILTAGPLSVFCFVRGFRTLIKNHNIDTTL